MARSRTRRRQRGRGPGTGGGLALAELALGAHRRARVLRPTLPRLRGDVGHGRLARLGGPPDRPRRGPEPSTKAVARAGDRQRPGAWRSHHHRRRRRKDRSWPEVPGRFFGVPARCLHDRSALDGGRRQRGRRGGPSVRPAPAAHDGRPRGASPAGRSRDLPDRTSHVPGAGRRPASVRLRLRCLSRVPHAPDLPDAVHGDAGRERQPARGDAAPLLPGPGTRHAAGSPASWSPFSISVGWRPALARTGSSLSTPPSSPGRWWRSSG